MAKPIETVFRDFTTDGNPSSGSHNPVKSDIRDLHNAHLVTLTGATSGAIVKSSLSSLNGDLAYDADTMAWVVGDGTQGNDGIYQKQGASGAGSWTRLKELPYNVIQLNNANAGTANAIQATTAVNIPDAAYGAIFVLNITAANTGAVTLSVNGETAKPVVTNTNQSIVSGYFVAGMAVLCIDDGASYRLMSYGDASAVQAAAEAAADEVRLSSAAFDAVYTNVTLYGAIGDGVTDDTVAIQAAADAAPEFSTLLFPKGTYKFSKISISKSLTVDLGGSDLLVDPGAGLVSGHPAIYFNGSLSSRKSINTVSTSYQDRVTLSTPSDISSFNEGDFVELLDYKSTAGWDDGIGSSSQAYSLRKEVNRIKEISGSTIYLEKSVEWDYDNSESATIAKISPIKSPKILNSGVIREVDNGGIHTGTTTNGPSIFGFYFCTDPLVDGVSVEGWQLNVVQFHMCMNPVIRRTRGRNPFRPTQGGHGYIVQFIRSHFGLAEQIDGSQCRHIVDFTQAYDCVSRNNVGYAPYGAQYTGHGQGAKRCKSVDDAVHFGGGELAIGWSWGNPSFSQDYDFDIIRPLVYGRSADEASSSIVFVSESKSERMYIENPKINLFSDNTATNYTKVLLVRTGAKDTKVRGGFIDVGEVKSTSSDYVISAEAEGLAAENLDIQDIRIIGANAQYNTIVRITDLTGRFVFAGNETFSKNLEQTHLRIDSTANLSVIEIVKNNFLNGGIRGILTQAAASSRYHVIDNYYTGVYSTAEKTLQSAANLIETYSGVS